MIRQYFGDQPIAILTPNPCTENKLSEYEGVGLYLHIPFCATKCRFCNFYMVPRQHPLTSRLISALISQLHQECQSQQIVTVYVGGGSPSHLPQADLQRLVEAINSRLSGPVEFTVEVNPDQVDHDLLASLFQLGVNRLSIGAQSFRDSELEWLSRTYQAERVRRVVAQAKQVGFENISLDLIYAIPGSNLDRWGESLQAAIGLEVSHVSAYSLTYEPGTLLDRQYQQGSVTAVSEQLDREMYELTIEMLGQAGIEQYEISNFAHPGFACLHNQRYWENLETLGIGPSAASYLSEKRSTNILGIRPYVEAVKKGESVVVRCEALSPYERACETAVLMLRQIRGIDLGRFQTRCGFDPLKIFAKPIEHYRDLGLLGVSDERIWLNRQALPIADSILCDFISPVA